MTATVNATSNLTDILNTCKWDVVDVLKVDPQEARTYSFDDTALSDKAKDFLRKTVPAGIYRHQKEALEEFLNGKDVCLATKTASGKSLVFYTSAIHILSKEPKAKILALYPARALASEQEERWKESILQANVDVTVGRLDGGVPYSKRDKIIKESDILIATPDVIHAWLMGNVGKSSVIEFLRNLKLIIVDEVHQYTGVFGSNSAFLFRRIQHVMDLLKAKAQFIAASATIGDPDLHLFDLFARKFTIIGPDKDTSPRHEITITFASPSGNKDLLSSVTEIIEHICRYTQHNFIVFVDSRKQAEHLASIANRSQDIDVDRLKKLNVLPYRSGYEEEDRRHIQQMLSQGKLRGVVSTSALELGIDIPHLTLAVLVGVPRSATSFWQRIGRVGRKQKGEVLIVNNGDFHTEMIFKDPASILNMPLATGALYLENRRIQYIHVLCLARNGGEHDTICEKAKIPQNSTTFDSNIPWSPGFLKLCNDERTGQIPEELRHMKMQAGNDPNHAFPLRDVDIQFQVVSSHARYFNFSPNAAGGFNLGTLSYSQVLNEAYPGAVYYYMSRPYRVCKVKFFKKEILVRPEKNYSTKPLFMPTLAYPDFNKTCLVKKYSDLVVAECDILVSSAVVGFEERRGSNVHKFPYPLDGKAQNGKATLHGVYFDHNKFTRNFFTTGVLILHPVLSQNGFNKSDLETLILESFLSVAPFDRTEIGCTIDRLRIDTSFASKGERFICVYDETYGSLHLSGKLMDKNILTSVLKTALKSSKDAKIRDILRTLLNCTQNNPEVVLNLSNTQTAPANFNTKNPKVIVPGSKGVNIRADNKVFVVEKVFYHPQDGLVYRGYYEDSAQNNKSQQPCMITVPVEALTGIPGETQWGTYDFETGEVIR